jgi:hypothetical protein
MKTVEAGGRSVGTPTRVERCVPLGELVEVEAAVVASRDRSLYTGHVTVEGQVLLEQQWRNY